MVKSDYNDKTS